MTPTRTNVLAELPRLRRYARVLAGSAGAVDDLVMATLACAWTRHPFGERRTSLGTWLIAVMRDVHASRPSPLGSREPPITDAATNDRAVDAMRAPSATPLDVVALPSMLAAFDRLPLDQREVLALVAVEQLSYADIAALLGVSVASVLATLGRAREALSSATAAAPPSGRRR